MIEAAVFLIFPLCLALAGFTDLFSMTIPNRIPAILLGSFLLISPFTGLGLQEIGFHLAMGVATFAVCFALFAFNAMGGGDAKLLTAAAVWFGPDQSLIEFFVYVAYIGCMLTILILLVRGHANKILAVGLSLPNSITHAKKIPYGIAIAIAGFLAFPSSPLLALAVSQLH